MKNWLKLTKFTANILYQLSTCSDNIADMTFRVCEGLWHNMVALKDIEEEQFFQSMILYVLRNQKIIIFCLRSDGRVTINTCKCVFIIRLRGDSRVTAPNIYEFFLENCC